MNRLYALIIPACLALTSSVAKADAICVSCMTQAQGNPLINAGVMTNQSNLLGMTQILSKAASAGSQVAAAPAPAPKNHLVNVAPIFANSTVAVQNGTLFQAQQGPVNWKVGDPLPWAQRPGQQELGFGDLTIGDLFSI